MKECYSNDNGDLMKSVFIAHVRNNKRKVQRLCDELTKHGVKVWLDRKDIALGVDWKQAIRRAIQDGAFFIACFSKEYNQRQKTYMNEELTLAIDELRQRPIDAAWFIPIKLNRCEIPDLPIGGGRTLRWLHYIEFYKDWNDAIQKILDLIHPIPVNIQRLIEVLHTDSIDIRLHAIEALGETGHSGAVLPLIEMLSDDDLGKHAFDALANIGEPAVPILIKAMNDEERTNFTRVYVACLLGKIADPIAAPALIDALRQERVLRNAADISLCIVQYCYTTRDMIHAEEVFDDEQFSACLSIASALSNIGEPAVPALIEALNDKNERVRGYAALVLGRIGDATAAPALTNTLNDGHDFVRRSAASALRWLGTPKELKGDSGPLIVIKQ